MNEEKHLRFLKSFPHLTDWLNLNGYALIYSHQDEYEQIHTMWSDHSSAAPLENGNSDAKEWLIITYCEHCNVIDVYKRVGVCAPGGDAALVRQMSSALPVLFAEDIENIIKEENDEPLY